VTKKAYDFAGWVTKNDIRCSDGVTIKHDAFKDNDGQKVPLVWNHDYNSPSNVLGHVILENHAIGVYGYGFFNNTEEAINANKMVKHGDISAMSIGARKLKRSGSNIIHGSIYEVSLVLSGANPGAMIDSVMTHSEGEEEEKGIVYTGNLIHSSDDVIIKDKKGDDDLETPEEKALREAKELILKHSKETPEEKALREAKELLLKHSSETAEEKALREAKELLLKHSGDKTIGDIVDTMNEEQKGALYALLGMVAESEDPNAQDPNTNTGADILKQNVFNKGSKEQDTLLHSMNEALKLAMDNKASSLKDVMANYKGAGAAGEELTLTHGINSIEMLFPEAAQSTNGNIPILYKDPNTGYKMILNAVTKSPFSKVRTLVADLTEDEARAKGYVKGSMKKEEFFSLIKRTTGPTTVYKKQKLDRDDIIDITDFDVVAFMNIEMRMMLEEEIARALLVGDGRDIADEAKINEQNIRPIISDNEFFTIHKSYASAAVFVDAVILAMSEYRGSGQPDMYIDPSLLASVKLLKGTDGRYLFGDIPSTAAIAARLGLGQIVPTSFMVGLGAIIVNLRDYTLGATKGGQITNFDDFDIDFNQYKYLIETRLSGSLTMPKSAIHFTLTTAATGANDTVGGMTYGTRQADKYEVSSLQITAPVGAAGAGPVSVTLNGAATSITVANNDTAIQVATKIRNATYAGWTTGGAGDTVTFTATKAGVITDATYSAGATGATGTMATTHQGY
jgi:HK97 family phage prohead protease